MSNYIKTTNFTSKDSLPTNDPGKVVRGAEIDVEFDAIASSVSTKADVVSPTFTGTPAAPTAVAGTNTTQIATTAFANAAVTAERTATATLTNKTLTSPTINGGTITGITDITVADGGTGVSSLTAENVILGDGTNPVKFVAPGTSGNVLTSNGTTWTSAVIPSQLIRATEQSTSSGTQKDFTGIPSGVKRITIAFDGISLDGGGHLLVQLGDSGGFEITGYISGSSIGIDDSTDTTGFVVRLSNSNRAAYGIMTLVNIAGNTWISSHACHISSGSDSAVGGGTKTLSDVLTQVRVTVTGNNFDAGQVNIFYE